MSRKWICIQRLTWKATKWSRYEAPKRNSAPASECLTNSPARSPSHLNATYPAGQRSTIKANMNWRPMPHNTVCHFTYTTTLRRQISGLKPGTEERYGWEFSACLLSCCEATVWQMTARDRRDRRTDKQTDRQTGTKAHCSHLQRILIRQANAYLTKINCAKINLNYSLLSVCLLISGLLFTYV